MQCLYKLLVNDSRKSSSPTQLVYMPIIIDFAIFQSVKHTNKMHCQNNCSLSFLDLIESMLDSNFNVDYETNKSYYFENEMVSRGLPGTKKELNVQILKKQKRNTLIQNIELLKNLIQEKNEEESLIHLARIINNVTTKEQKLTFINELQYDTNRSDNNNADYNGESTIQQNDYLIPRSTVPELGKSDSLNSYQNNSNHNSFHLNKLNSDEQYLVHKGLHYCRVLLSNFFHERNNSFIQELKSRNILHYVVNEQIDGKNSYLMDLVESYPLSCEEIIFILKQDENVILDSPIFVLLAERNVNQLYEFLSRLSADKIDKDKLSQSCDNSSFNGYRVCHLISKNKKPEEAVSCVKIETFLNRYKYQKNC